MNYSEYITASLAKDSIGAQISVGLFAVVGIYAILGIYFGISRGFTKSLIRFFTVGASAIFSIIVATTASATLVASALGSGSEAQSLKEWLSSYSPDIINSVPSMFQPLLGEISAETTMVFFMMLVSLIITPIVFILVFFILKLLTIIIYKILAGLAGAISYNKGFISTVLGGVVGLAQGLCIAAVIIIPVSGLFGIAEEAKAMLVDPENPNEAILSVYDDVIDDVIDNPLFDLIDKAGGNVVYEKLVTATVGSKTYNMKDECLGLVEIGSDFIPVFSSDFNWKNPTDEQRAELYNLIDDIANNELVASLVSDVMRGAAACIQEGTVDIGLTGAPKILVNEAVNLFATENKDTISGDFHLFVDIYFIMCDYNLIDSFVSADSEAIRDALTAKNANGNTAIDALLERLNAYDRAQPIITSFTKLSITIMMGSAGLDEDTQELYENVKDDIVTVLNHSKSDFETEEEYKEAVSADLDKALTDNNIEIADDVKEQMVDYIAENYGDHEGEITEKEINDALLSYYQSYVKSQENNNAEGEDAPEAE